MTITNKGYGALGKGMTELEARMDALRRIKEAVPGVLDKGTPPTKTGDTRTEKLGMGIMQSLPEGDETQTAFIPALGLAAGAGGLGVLGYLLQKQYELEQKIRQYGKENERQRELLKPPEERSENMLPSKGASNQLSGTEEYIQQALLSSQINNEGIAQLPALKGGGMMLFPTKQATAYNPLRGLA